MLILGGGIHGGNKEGEIMKYKTQQYHIKLAFTAVLVTIAACSSAQNQINTIGSDVSMALERGNNNRYGTSSEDSLCILKRDYGIIKGDGEEYRKYRVYWMYSEYDEQKSCNMQRERLMYSFIMAEVYRDTLAAFDFTQQIEFMDIYVDSILGAKIIDFLEMVSKSKPDIISLAAARKLREIYKKGLYSICQDMEKSNYYNQLADYIAKTFPKKQKEEVLEGAEN